MSRTDDTAPRDKKIPLGVRVRVTRRLKADAAADAKAAAIDAANMQAESAARALGRLEHGTATLEAEIVALKESILARDGAPHDLQCPISHELMRDPVELMSARRSSSGTAGTTRRQ